MRIIVAVTGATGVQMSEILLRALRYQKDCEIHLIVSEGARLTWNLECDREITMLYSLADYVYREEDLAAIIASGSFVTNGMIILPCSMKTLSGIVSGYAENLIQRAADVCLKEGRKVVLVPREMPLGKVHLKNLKKAAAIGCAIVPPMLTFYNGAKTLEEQVDHVIGKVLLQFQLEYEKFVPWRGISEPGVPQNEVENRCEEKQETDTLIKIDKKLSCGTLCIQAQQIGDDLQILLWGGSRPHIGCVVLSSPRASLKGNGKRSSTSSVMNRIGHKDEEICRAVAEETAIRTGKTVVCSGGVHVEDICDRQILEVREAVRKMTQELVTQLSEIATES